MKSKIGIIVLDNCAELGNKVGKHLQILNKDSKNCIIPIDEVRFNNGESKVVIKETVREKTVFIMSDIGNYSKTYNMFGYENHMSPDEHFQDIKRVISAIGGHASKIILVMPLLYASRQHKRKGRESLDCAIALQELETLGVSTIITFDAHDPNVQNAIPCLSFENFYPTHIMIEKFIENEKPDFENILVISPDTGAMDRARYYADMLNCDMGMFYKRRDLSIVVDGKNPIVAHEYIGKDVAGKDIIVVDDMVASGNSILDVVTELKNRKARKIYVFATFALFTKGIKEFNNIYTKGKIERSYASNLSYIPSNIKKQEWFKEVDCSNFLANIINTLDAEQSLSPLFDGKEQLLNKIDKTK
jgi:ribose-phosphate pyrophosphokinase